MDHEDSRFASFEECWEIFVNLSEELKQFDERKTDVLKAFDNFSQVSYDPPLDYKKRLNSKIHSKLNTKGIDDLSKKIITLRKFLLIESNPYEILVKIKKRDKLVLLAF